MKNFTPLSILAFTLFCGAAAAADPSALVRLAPAKQGTLTPQIAAYGIVSADPNFVTTVFMPRDAVIASLLVRPGQTVKAGDPLVMIRTAPAAAATYEQAVSSADFAAKEYARTQQLFASQLATRSQLATAAKANADAQALLSAQEKVGANHTEETLTAPVAGIVATLVPARGDPVQPGADVATIATGGHDVLNLGVEPQDAFSIQPGNNVFIDAQQDRGALQGRVEAVGGLVDPTSHLVNVLVSLPPNTHVLIGSALRARIALTPKQGIIIPSAALLTDGASSYVFVVQGGKAKRRDVKVAFESNGNAMITSGLKASEQVVVQGMVGLDDGTAVRTSE